MMGDDNRVKEVLLKWLSKQTTLKHTRKPKKLSRPSRMSYSWNDLMHGNLNEVWLAQTWVEHTFEEARKPPAFCKSFKGTTAFDTDEPAGTPVKDHYITYWHPNAWDRIRIMEQVANLNIDVSDFYAQMPHQKPGVVKDWIMMETRDHQLVFEGRLLDTYYLKIVPESLFNFCKAYAIERGRLFPSLETLLDENSNVTYLKFK